MGLADRILAAGFEISVIATEELIAMGRSPYLISGVIRTPDDKEMVEKAIHTPLALKAYRTLCGHAFRGENGKGLFMTIAQIPGCSFWMNQQHIWIWLMSMLLVVLDNEAKIKKTLSCGDA